MSNEPTSNLGKVIRRIFNVRGWLDWERVKSFTQYLSQGIKKLFMVQERQSDVPFESVSHQFNLSDAELLSKQKALFRLSLLMLLVAILILSYSIYLLVLGHYAAFGLSIVVTLIALVLAFRYHYWYFQIKTRQLGCSLHQWYRQGILGDKP